MLVLAIEASTQFASVALLKDDRLLGEFVSDNPKTHSEILNQAIDDLLVKNSFQLSDVDLYAVDFGPGSFTGVRVALSIVRAFAFLFDRPIFSLSSLEIIKKHSAHTSKNNFVSMINAYKNMIYTSVYLNNNLVFGPSAIQVVEFKSNLEKIVKKFNLKNQIFDCAGDGYSAYQSFFSTETISVTKDGFELKPCTDKKLNYPSATTLAFLAFQFSKSVKNNDKTLDWKSAIPLYLRASAAEENIK